MWNLSPNIGDEKFPYLDWGTPVPIRSDQSEHAVSLLAMASGWCLEVLNRIIFAITIEN